MKAGKSIVALLADYETRKVRVEFGTPLGYLSGRILGGNREVCMFELEPRPGSPIQHLKYVDVVLASVVTIRELPEKD